MAGAAPALAADPVAPAVPSVALGTPVFSLRRVPDLVARTTADRHLGADLDRVLAEPALAGARERTCLIVGEPRGGPAAAGPGGAGPTHYSRQPALGLIPASTLKLLTTATALAQLGPEVTFRTELKPAAAPIDGAVGDLYMVGGGDPLLSTADFSVDAGYLGQPRRSTSIEALADKVAAAGVRRIGRIVGDESRYDSQRLVPSWNPRYISDFEISPISALVVNKAFTSSNPAAVAVSPPSHAAGVLAVLLRARGITVGESVAGKAPAGLSVLASIDSAPLRDVVAEVLQNSDNLAAEMLLKELGSRPGTPGTTAAGLAAVAAHLGEIAGPGAPGLATVDGSGLDRSDRLTCSLLQGVLGQAGPSGPLTMGLPVAGRNGTLFRRFVGTSAAGKVRAKTGSLEGVAALAGFATAKDGRTLTFSLLANDLPNASTGSAMQDKVVNVLAGYPRAPGVEEIGPRPVRPVTP